MIDSVVKRNNYIWKTLLKRSEEYMKKLNVTKHTVGSLTRTIRIGDHEFEVSADDTCGCPYKDTWRKVIQVSCENVDSLNMSSGHGTIFINIIPEEWHQRILAML
jgi:hypothetical protein